MTIPRPEILWHRQRIWSQATFGSDQERGPEGALAHLGREVVEIQAAPHDLEEYADAQLLLWDACRRAGFTQDQLWLAVSTKQDKNERRRWAPPDAEGVCVHIEEPCPRT